MGKAKIWISVMILFLLVGAVSVPLVASNLAFDGAASKIQHIVFIVQENHSFDNYFGTYPGANGLPLGISIPVNLDAGSTATVSPFHLNVAQPISIVAQPGMAVIRLLDPNRSARTGPLRTGRRHCPPPFLSRVSRNCRQNRNPCEIPPRPPGPFQS